MFLEPVLAAETVRDGVGAFEFARGAIAGAVIVGAAFLAGLSALRGGAAALSALVVLLGAAAFTAMSLGMAPALAPPLMDIFASVFAAAVLVFLAATIRTARVNPVLGGAMFVSALGLVGTSVASAAMQGELATALRFGLMGVAGFAAILAVFEAVRGDRAAALILPGVAAAAVAFLFPSLLIEATGFALAPQATFMAGVIAASLTALGEARGPGAAVLSIEDAVRDAGRSVAPATPAFEARENAAMAAVADPAAETSVMEPPASAPPAVARCVSENQLAEVLDYAGLAVWDWSPSRSHQSESFAGMIGATAGEVISPQSLGAFVARRDRARFESSVLGGGDGPFDQTLHFQNGAEIRLRGARAVDRSGRIDRFIAFCEPSRTAMAGHGDQKREQKLLEHRKPDQRAAVKESEAAHSAQPDAALTRAAVSLSQTAAAVGTAPRHASSPEVGTDSQALAVDAAEGSETKTLSSDPAPTLEAEKFSKPAALLEAQGAPEDSAGGAAALPRSDIERDLGASENAAKVPETVGAPALAARGLRDDRPSSRLFRQRPFGRGMR